MINELQAIFDAYKEKSLEVRRKAPAFAGILGLGSDPRRHPCHEEFYESVVAWTDNFAKTEPSAEAAMELAGFLMEQPNQNRGTDAFWFIFLTVGCIRTLIPLLKKEDCKTLVQRFDELYKKRERMPIQEETYKKLVKASK